MDFYSLIILLVMLSWDAARSLSSMKRSKRVLNGEPLNGRPTTYKAIRYYAALATRHGVAWYDFILDGKYGDILCSGSLTTPAVLQTACHCVARFNAASTKQFIKRPIVKNHWEDNTVVYPGVSNRYGKDSMVTYSYISTQKYIVHEKCGRLGASEAATHDYGLVRLDSDWIKSDCHTPYPWIEMEWSPQYTVESMLDFHEYALTVQLVCLIVGFGAYSQSSPVSSYVLRVGWAHLIPLMACVNKTTNIPGIPKDFRQGDITWSCTHAFPKHPTQSGAGDSGGPLTCNNHYFGVVSGTTIQREVKTRKILNYVTRVHAVIHNLLMVAIEYRPSLINSIYRLPETYPDPKGRARRSHFKEFSRFHLLDAESSSSRASKLVCALQLIRALLTCLCFLLLFG